MTSFWATFAWVSILVASAFIGGIYTAGGIPDLAFATDIEDAYAMGYHAGWHDGAGWFSYVCDPETIGAVMCLGLGFGSVFSGGAILGLVLGRRGTKEAAA